MKALAVCATYGRLPYLGRMLSSFIHQSYDDKHLVIINDDVNVEICCNLPNITILNCRNRLPIAYKRNLGVAVGEYDVIFPMDDDDVFLPDKMANHMKKYDHDNSIGAYWSKEGYIIYGDEFRPNNPGPHNCMSYTKKAWFQAGGYSDNHDFEDYDLFTRLQNIVEEDAERDFVYCFGGVNYHVSCEPKQYDTFEQISFKQLESMGLVGKKFWIQPDFEQFNNICLLDKIYQERQEPLLVKHISDAKIDISHLL